MTSTKPTDLPMDEIVDYSLGFIPEGSAIDWDDLLYRIETVFNIDLGNSMVSPEIKAIRRAIRVAVKERGE